MTTTESTLIDLDPRPPRASIEVFRGDSSPRLAEMKDIRLRFVTAMRWFDPATHKDDTDRYDSLSETLHLGKIAEENPEQSLVASMRLTQVNERAINALSVEMLRSQASGEMMRELEGSPHWDLLNRAAAEGRLFDLTRFVVNFRQRPSEDERERALLEMIGAGIELTAPESSKDVLWVFTETSSMNDTLDRLGVVNARVTTGIITPGRDREASSLCIAYPLEALEFVHNNPMVYQRTIDCVHAGIESIRDRRIIDDTL